ncbi:MULTISPECIES: 16S rRNA (uracil(1498)-N(3))-methyltransferase [Lactobacillaceae]|uniref:16S rRNA (uracil(1498)-N(3))-methyltransferase n=1 Tax=Lactobacillaceae TaxID=33958 RepID=UPI00145794CD|nr:16S rRNA (uracil(1498)-N(3))-methyltransferase [Lactobacillus sp. HBUAS51381]NLR08599.1 16S rRNA (uracil(1498)-N(3))-methyltransferase [Lactobacillus sp. HBUAS51381]
MQRYFLEATQHDGDQVTLSPVIYHHWVTVLRAEIGATAEFVDDTAHLFHGELTQIVAEQAIVTLTAVPTPKVELPVQAIIACGLPKQEKAEWITQKATELGVDRIIFFGGDWSVAKWQGNKVEKKLKRLAKIADGAAEQSHRLRRPVVSYARNLAEVLQEPVDVRLMAYEESAKQGERSALNQQLQALTVGQRVLTIFGPEGGISPAEVAAAQDTQTTLVGLGPRILRTETAPLYFLSALSVVLELQQPR